MLYMYFNSTSCTYSLIPSFGFGLSCIIIQKSMREPYSHHESFYLSIEGLSILIRFFTFIFASYSSDESALPKPWVYCMFSLLCIQLLLLCGIIVLELLGQVCLEIPQMEYWLSNHTALQNNMLWGTAGFISLWLLLSSP